MSAHALPGIFHNSNVAFASSYQNTGRLAVPRLLQPLHLATAVAGIAGCCAILFLAPRRHLATGLAVAVLVALLANAAVTGGLSGPHERYQSRIMWLPPVAALLGLPLCGARNSGIQPMKRTQAADILWFPPLRRHPALCSFASALLSHA